MSIPTSSLNNKSGYSPVSGATRSAGSPLFGSTVEGHRDSYSGRRRGQAARSGAFSRLGQWFGRKWAEFRVWLHGGSIDEEMPRPSLKKRIMGKMTLAGVEMYLQKHPGMNLFVKGILPTAAVVGTGALLHQSGNASRGIGEVISNFFAPPVRKGMSTTTKVALGAVSATAAGFGTHQLIKSAVKGGLEGSGQALIDKNLGRLKEAGDEFVDTTVKKVPILGWFRKSS